MAFGWDIWYTAQKGTTLEGTGNCQLVRSHMAVSLDLEGSVRACLYNKRRVVEIKLPSLRNLIVWLCRYDGNLD